METVPEAAPPPRLGGAASILADVARTRVATAHRRRRPRVHDAKAHLQPIPRAPEPVKRKKPRARPPLLDEPTQLEQRLEAMTELRGTSQRITSILDAFDEKDRSVPREDPDLGRLVVDDVFRTSEWKRQDVSNASRAASVFGLVATVAMS